MRQSGITIDGKPVYSNIFKLVGTHGVQLETILYKFYTENKVVDWEDYIKSALKDGHKPRTIKARIISAIGEIYGATYCEEFTKILQIMLPS